MKGQHRKEQKEGVKDRPCAIILVTQDAEGDQLVTVLQFRGGRHSPIPFKWRLHHNTALSVERDSAACGSGARA